MRRIIVILIAIGAVLSATAFALTVQVTFPARTKAKIGAVVDEMGNVLFGATPGKVEVTNFPASSSDETFNMTFSTPGTHPSLVVTTVPADRALILTDIDGAYACAPNDDCRLSDSTGTRLVWYAPTSARPRTYTSGIRFEPGETVIWDNPYGGTVDSGNGITFMGRLIPAP